MNPQDEAIVRFRFDSGRAKWYADLHPETHERGR